MLPMNLHVVPGAFLGLAGSADPQEMGCGPPVRNVIIVSKSPARVLLVHVRRVSDCHRCGVNNSASLLLRDNAAYL